MNVGPSVFDTRKMSTNDTTTVTVNREQRERLGEIVAEQYDDRTPLRFAVQHLIELYDSHE